MNKVFVKRGLKDFIDLGEIEIKTGPFGTQLHASDYVEKGTAVINVRNIGYGRIKNDKLEYINEETVQRLSSHLLKQNDIVFGRKGAVDRHALIMPNQQGWFQGSDCLRIRIKSESLYPLFLSYYFLTDTHKKWMMAQCSHGATMASLNQDIISRIPVYLPNIQIQQKIASILSNYDDLIENNTRRIEILEQMAKLVYEEWFVKFRFPGHEKVKMVSSELGEIPEGWEIKKLYDLIEIKKGKKAKNIISNTTQNTTPYILIDGLKTGSHVYTDDDNGVFVKKHETIMVMDGASSGKVFIGCEGFVGSTLAAIKNKNGVDIDPYFIFSFLSNNFEKIVPNNIGSAIPHANKDFIFNMCIILPPKNLMSYSFTIFHRIYNLKNILISKNQNLRKTRDLLLPKLISGEIDVSDLDIRIRNEYQEHNIDFGEPQDEEGLRSKMG